MNDIVNSAKKIVPKQWNALSIAQKEKACERYCQAIIHHLKQHPCIIYFNGKRVDFDLSNLDANISCEIVQLEGDIAASFDHNSGKIFINNDFFGDGKAYTTPKFKDNASVDLFYYLPHEITHKVQNFLLKTKQITDKERWDYLNYLESNISDISLFINKKTPRMSLHFNKIITEYDRLEKLSESLYILSVAERSAFSFGQKIGDNICHQLKLFPNLPHEQIDDAINFISYNFNINRNDVISNFDLCFLNIKNHIVPKNAIQDNLMRAMIACGQCLTELGTVEAHRYESICQCYDTKIQSIMKISHSQEHDIDNNLEKFTDVILYKSCFERMTEEEQRANILTVMHAFVSGTADP